MEDNLFLPDNVIARLGTITHYNGLLFGDLFAEQADCEGALAVGGDVVLGSPGHGYDVGAASVAGWASVVIGKYDNPEGYPSFLLGGGVSPQSVSAQIYGGPVVLKNSYQQQYESGSFRFGTNDLRYEPDADIADFFAYAGERLGHTGNILLNGTAQRITLGDIPSLTSLDQSVYLSETIETDKKILIYTIECAGDDLITLSDIGFGNYINEYDAIIINAACQKVEFRGGAILYDGSIVNTSIPQIYAGNELIALLASKVVFNFPDADEVRLENYGLIGSLIAPRAEINGMGGSINGMLAANSLNQRSGKELHAFTLPMGEGLLSLESKNEYRGITVNKTDGETAQPLAGAQFTLYETADQTVFSGTTGPDGLLIFEQLVPGIYRLEENTPPPGYSLPEVHEWLIDLTNNTEGETQEMEIIYIQNTRTKYEVSFLKLDYDDSRITLGNAVFSLYVYNPQEAHYELLEAGLTTNAQGVLNIDELLPGSYRLLEMGAPAGYYLPEDYTVDFIVDTDGTVDIADNDVVSIYNQKLASILLVKHDYDNQALVLEGAVYDLYLYNEDTDAYEVLSSGHTTNTAGEILIPGLLPGSYKFVETAAPNGYYLAPGSEIEFVIEVDIDKRIIEPSDIFAANKQLGKIQIYKVDSADYDLLLEGAEFTLYKYNDDESKYEEYRTGIVSDENGSVLIEGLEPGEYKLIETKSPAGYTLPENPETLFTIVI